MVCTCPRGCFKSIHTKEEEEGIDGAKGGRPSWVGREGPRDDGMGEALEMGETLVKHHEPKIQAQGRVSETVTRRHD